MSESEKGKSRDSHRTEDQSNQSEQYDETIDVDLDVTQPLNGHTGSQSGQPRPGLSLEQDQIVGDYKLVRPLGSGGFAEVWEVSRLADGRKLALKILQVAHHVSADAVARFQREGRLAASLSHPRAVGIVGAEVIDGSPTILMEVMPGGTLQDQLKTRGPMAWRQAVDAILDVLEGLEAAHKLDIIHRDIKPSNCFVDREGRVKIGDFGLSKTLEMSVDLTMVGTIIGTPAYASPEQIRGLEVDFRSDQYSAGATLYALLTGKPPYEGVSPVDLIAKITSDTPFTPLKEHGVGIPKGLLKVLKRLLELDPAGRYEDYPAVRAALLPFSSRGFLPAQLGPRIAAGVLDIFVATSVATPIMIFISRPLTDTRVAFVANVIALLVFLLLEKHWGKTPGKHFMRLRVASGEGTSLSWPQAIIRNFVWAVPSFASNLTSLLVSGQTSVSFLVGAALTASLFVTSRKRNGFAGIHELLSNTRVIRNRSLVEAVSIKAPAKAVVLSVASYLPEQLGPYRLKESLWSNEKGSLVVASDDQLGRHVWICEGICEESEPSPGRGESRVTRLAWLQSGQHEDRVWDAFEAPSGMPLTDLLQEIDWPRISSLLADLLSEIREGLRKQDLPPVLSMNNIWVDGFGRLKLLEFPAGQAATAPALGKEFLAPEWPRFIEHIVRTLMPNEERPWSQDLTGSQKDLLDGLLGGKIKESDLPAVESKLQELRDSSTFITRKRRFGHLVSTYAVPSIFLVPMFLAIAFAGAIASGFHILLIGFGFVALPAILMTALFGSGPGMKVFSMEIRNARGECASRARCLMRALLAWSPALLNLTLIILWLIKHWGNPTIIFWPVNGDEFLQILKNYHHFLKATPELLFALSSFATGTVFIVGLVLAVKNPSRGLHDRLAKTHIGLR